ncbi:odorant receptor 4-like [Schistocerca americana]|uniref:odorant receptor 4-like n=1 Tax=Schistocerca americana TaxID=7009 RepID=UPI001F4F8D8E|nr:odorant receptor 4-like [Schistocerca americana]
MCGAVGFTALFVHFSLLAAAHLEAIKRDLCRPACRLPSLVRHHQGVLRFLAEMEDVYNLKATFDLTTVQMLMFFAIYFCNVAVICYFGSMITSQAESVRLSAYCSEWPERDLAFRRGVLLVMARATRGATLTVGRCKPVSIRTFSAMLQESFSYLMVMLSIARRNAALGEDDWMQTTTQGANSTVATHH